MPTMYLFTYVYVYILCVWYVCVYVHLCDINDSNDTKG